MKKTLNIGIGGKSFIIDEDAHERLKNYLETFRSRLTDEQGSEVMNDIEARIAELLLSNLGSGQQSVSLALVNQITAQLGMPDGSSTEAEEPVNAVRKLYRDTDDVRIAGVCSGLALYFGIDTSLVRILMLVALIAGSVGFWLYVILWIAVPKAVTPAQKCELRGLAPTAGNMAKFTTYKK